MFRRAGVTLVEVFVAIFIIAILVALLLPAVQRARSSAHRTSCADNLRQTAVAVHGYHAKHSVMPALHNGVQRLPPRDRFLGTALSWRTLLLPYLDQQALFARIDFRREASHATNLPVAEVVLPAFLCPAAPQRFPNRVPTGKPFVFRRLYRFNGSKTVIDDNAVAAMSDYAPSVEFRADYAGSQPTTRVFGAWGEVYRDKVDPWTGNVGYQRRVSFADITDGLSNTLLVTELAGFPDLYGERGHLPVEPPDPEIMAAQNAWAITAPLLFFVAQEKGGMINRSNAATPFAFHTGGANGAFADGSVRFLQEGMTNEAFAAALSRDHGDAIGTE